MTEPIQYAEITWTEGVPFSPRFQDVYYSRFHGLEETRHVFLKGNRLPDRFFGRSCFTVAETGFGTGLNFLALRDLFIQITDENQRLEFFSCEKFPLCPPDLDRALSQFPELDEGRKLLLESFQSHPVPGFRRILFDKGRVALNIYYGDVSDYIRSLAGPVDAWFLDGFAPSRNESMWASELFPRMGQISLPETTIATFSVAGSVRRGLAEAGFRVEKIPGYGGKREMLVAEYPDNLPEKGNQRDSDSKSRSSYKSFPESARFYRSSYKLASSDHAIVIGGGIAGSSVSWSLARRGVSVTLIERENDVAMRASGNPAGIIFPFLNALSTPMSRYLIQCFQFVLDRIKNLESSGLDVRLNRCGVIQLSHEERQQKRFDSALKNLGYPPEIVRAVEESEASELAGFPVRGRGVFFERGLWIHPPHVSKGNLKQAGERVRLITGTEVAHIYRRNNAYLVENSTGDVIAEAPILVIAAGQGTMDMDYGRDLPVKRTRGQIALVPSTEKSRRLKRVVCYDGYVIPEVEGKHVVGASYERSRSDLDLDPEVNRELLSMLDGRVPGLLEQQEIASGRVDFRTISFDHMPLIGAIPNRESYMEMLNRGKGGEATSSDSFYPGLFISAGHGSRGMNYAPLGGELIAALALGEPPPVEMEIVNALSPARFLIREWKRAQK